MRGFAYVLCTLAAIMLIVVLIFAGVQVYAFDIDYYDREYRKLDTARNIGMTQEELLSVTTYLLDYMQGDKDNLRIKTEVEGKERYAFDEREREHMVDVAALYRGARGFSLIAVTFAAVTALLGALLVKKDRLLMYAKSYTIGAVIICALILGIGIWVMIDFTSFWDSFHLLLFTNDLWLLDPRTSLMINMFPEQFFFDLVTGIIKFVTLTAGTLFVAAAGYIGYRRYRRRSLLTVRTK